MYSSFTHSFSIYKALSYLLSYLLLLIETHEVGKPAVVQPHPFQLSMEKKMSLIFLSLDPAIFIQSEGKNNCLLIHYIKFRLDI